MRGAFGLAGFLLLSCSGGDDGTERKDPEICDDEIDNNDDGLVDCEDEASCGGLVCRDPSGDDDDDTTVPTPDVEILWDPSACCDFEYDCPGGDKSIGTFAIVNHLADADAEFDISCTLVGPQLSPIEFQVVGSSAAPVPFVVNADVYAGAQVTVEAFFVCKPQLSQDFSTTCKVIVETEDDEWEQEIPIDAAVAR